MLYVYIWINLVGFDFYILGRVKHVRGTFFTLVTTSLAFSTEMLVILHWEEERLGSS